MKTKDYLGRTAMQYASNEAAADFLEKRANQTIPYEGREYLQLRVDTEVRKGAGAPELLFLQTCVRLLHPHAVAQPFGNALKHMPKFAEPEVKKGAGARWAWGLALQQLQQLRCRCLNQPICALLRHRACMHALAAVRCSQPCEAWGVCVCVSMFAAVGHVYMAKATATGDPLAIKFHNASAARDTSFDVLKKLVNKVSRQFLVAPPAGMSDAEVREGSCNRGCGWRDMCRAAAGMSAQLHSCVFLLCTIMSVLPATSHTPMVVKLLPASLLA